VSSGDYPAVIPALVDAQPKIGRNMTNLRIRVEGADNNSSECNAILCYEAEYVPETSKQAVQKVFFKQVQTEPNLQTLFVLSANLDQFVTQQVDSTASNIVLYSVEGLAKRNKAKREIEDAVTRKTCIGCCLTCGLILCVAGCCDPCGATDVGETNLTEQGYCQKLTEQYPGQTQQDPTLGFELVSDQIGQLVSDQKGP
jgi:hypothetical protein